MGYDTDPWRAYFRDAECNIFDILENVIRVAASDHPEEFRQRRGRLVELIFSCKFCKCQGCDKYEGNLPVRDREIENVENEECELENGFESDERGRNEADVADGTDEGSEMIKQETNITDWEIEVFADEIEQEHQIIAEVLQLKEVILDDQVEDYLIICKSLKKLQSLALTVDILRATGIGKVVNPLQRHGVEEIRNLARILIQNWKLIVDAWVHASGLKSTEKEKEEDKKDESEDDESHDSINLPHSPENFGSDFPPVDEAAFLAGNHDQPMELWKILDDVDEHGNIIKNDEMVVITGDKRKSFVQKPSIIELKQLSFSEVHMNRSFQQMDKRVSFKMPSNPDRAESGTDKPAGAYIPQNSNKPKSCRIAEDNDFSKRPKVGEGNRVEPSNENAEEMKLEAVKKKLINSCKQVQKANKSTVQMINLHDLPKVSLDEEENPGHRRKQFKYRNIFWNGVKGKY